MELEIGKRKGNRRGTGVELGIVGESGVVIVVAINSGFSEVESESSILQVEMGVEAGRGIGS